MSDVKQVAIFDTTLRDGAQTEGISFSCEDKLRIARRLDEFGIAYIEAGWPGSNPKDVEFFERARDMDWRSARIVAFGATRRRGVECEDDANLKALVAVGTEVCSLVGKTWTLHVTEVLRVDHDENLRMIEESVGFLRRSGRRVIYDAEHFFDGYRADPAYAIETLRAAERGGAETLVLCDTNGGAMPWDVEAVVGTVRATLSTPLGVHCHNDGELAVANSIAAVRGGASQVQGTINGIGERCGNANLCAIIPDLQVKLGYACVPETSLSTLADFAHFVAEVANLSFNEQMAYVGRSAFAHKGGIHVAAMRRNEGAYQHIDPARVGNTMRVVVSELSGRGNLLSKAEELGLGAEVAEPGQVEGVLEEIKALEARGFSFEAAEASVALMLSRRRPGYVPPFVPIDHTVVVENRGGSSQAQAMVKVEISGQRHHTAAEAEGPVEALDIALRRALEAAYPAVLGFHLVDYKVRILDSSDGTKATTRVLIDSRCGERSWSTVGASKNIIEACWRALLDSYEYGLLEAKHAERPERPKRAAKEEQGAQP